MKLMYVVKMENEGWWGDKSYTKVGIALDTEQKKIYIDHLGGVAADYRVVLLPLAIREIRKELKEFLENYKRKEEFKVEYSTGMSGREDYVLKTRSVTTGGFDIIKKRASLHISCNEKLNEGFDPMYIGDYLEIVAEFINNNRNLREALKDLIDEHYNETYNGSITRNAIKKISTHKWRPIRNGLFRTINVQKVWKIKTTDNEDWKQPYEII